MKAVPAGKGRNAVRLWPVRCSHAEAPLCITRPLPPLSPQAEAAGQDGGVLQTHLRGRPAHGAAGQVPGKRSEPIPQERTPPLDWVRGAPFSVCLSLGVSHAVDREPSGRGGWRGAPERGRPPSDSSSALTLLRPLPLESQPGLQNPHHTLRPQREPRGTGPDRLLDPHRAPLKDLGRAVRGPSNLPCCPRFSFLHVPSGIQAALLLWSYLYVGKESSRKTVSEPLPSSAPSPVPTCLLFSCPSPDWLQVKNRGPASRSS